MTNNNAVREQVRVTLQALNLAKVGTRLLMKIDTSCVYVYPVLALVSFLDLMYSTTTIYLFCHPYIIHPSSLSVVDPDSLASSCIYLSLT